MLEPMILHRIPTPRPRRRPAAIMGDESPAPAVLPVPGWLRGAVGGDRTLAAQGLDDVALAAGAAIATLDATVRRHARWEGVWRQRLALSAAAMTARAAGRIEDEAALRDAVLLTKAGDDVGPAGRMFLGWRRLAARPAAELLGEAGIAGVVEDFGHAGDDEAVGGLAREMRRLADGARVAGAAAAAFAAAERHGFGPVLGAWLADALLARQLGWAHAMPLLGMEAAPRPGRKRGASGVIETPGMETEADRTKRLLAAQARAALRAVDLFAELGRRAERLVAIAPKLRAKASGAVVESLFSQDALVASQTIAGISDRGLRRLFDRLTELGAVRELTGRPTFRIYGL